MDLSDWDARIETWLAGPDDDLSGVVDLLLMDFSWEEDEDENEMSMMTRAEMRVEDLIYDLDVTPLNLKRIQGWCQTRILPAAAEALLTSSWPIMTKDERDAAVVWAKTNFCRELVNEWLQVYAMRQTS